MLLACRFTLALRWQKSITSIANALVGRRQRSARCWRFFFWHRNRVAASEAMAG